MIFDRRGSVLTRDALIPETRQVFNERSKRQVRYIERVLTVCARETCKEFLEIFFKSVQGKLRFIAIHCFKNGWGENCVAFLLDFARSFKFSAHQYPLFLSWTECGKRNWPMKVSSDYRCLQ